MRKIGVLGSGSGSNLQAILGAVERGDLQVEVALVLSDQPGAYILERARLAGIPADVIDCAGYHSRFPEESQRAVGERLQQAGVELVCLAGFMRLVKEPLLHFFPKRILNIHPSLLPSYPGLAAWEQALADGATQSGCTVHYVDEGMDTGEIILQKVVPVFPDDDSKSLHARIQQQEHFAYPEAISRVLETI